MFVVVVEDEWSVERVRRLAGQATPDYAVIEKNGAFLSVASEKPFKMEYDSVKPVEEPKAAGSRDGEGKFIGNDTTKFWAVPLLISINHSYL